MEYGQFCPLAKAMDILGERWTLLILRELHMGATRFNEIQRGLNFISPTILTKRLNYLAATEMVMKKKIPGQRSYEYFLTRSGKETLPIIEVISEWGMCWARGDMSDSDLDVELLMLYLQRSIKPEQLPGNQTVIKFQFTNLRKFSNWWLVVKRDNVDICLEDRGHEIDVYFTTNLQTMIKCWMGEKNYNSAIKDQSLSLVGPSILTRNVESWLNKSFLSGIRSADEIYRN